jgi:hypothetical protein
MAGLDDVLNTESWNKVKDNIMGQHVRIYSRYYENPMVLIASGKVTTFNNGYINLDGKNENSLFAGYACAIFEIADLEGNIIYRNKGVEKRNKLFDSNTEISDPKKGLVETEDEKRVMLSQGEFYIGTETIRLNEKLKEYTRAKALEKKRVA